MWKRVQIIYYCILHLSSCCMLFGLPLFLSFCFCFVWAQYSSGLSTQLSHTTVTQGAIPNQNKIPYILWHFYDYLHGILRLSYKTKTSCSPPGTGLQDSRTGFQNFRTGILQTRTSRYESVQKKIWTVKDLAGSAPAKIEAVKSPSLTPRYMFLPWNKADGSIPIVSADEAVSAGK